MYVEICQAGRIHIPREYVTKELVDRLKSTDGKPVYVWDTSLKGFGVGVAVSGRKTFVVQQRSDGRSFRVTLGTYGSMTVAQARDAAMEVISGAKKGINPIEARETRSQDRREAEQRAIATSDLFERWMEQHVRPKRAPRTVLDYEKNWRGYLAPRFAKTPAQNISKSDVSTMHFEMRETPRVANYAIVTLRAMINWAIDQEILDPDHRNPAGKIELYEEHERERYLTPDEMRRVGQVITELVNEGGVTAYAAAALMLSLLTGADPASSNKFAVTRWISTGSSLCLRSGTSTSRT